MKIRVKKGRLENISAEAIVIYHYEDAKKPAGKAAVVDAQSGGRIKALLRTGDFEGKLNQTAVVYTSKEMPAKRIILLGLGKKKELNAEKLRGAFARAAQQVRSLRLKEFAFSLDVDDKALSLDALTEAAVEGVLLGLYQFTSYKTLERDKIRDIEALTIVDENVERVRTIERAAKTAGIIAEAVYFVRDMVSTPANEMTPTDMAGKAKMIARDKAIKCRILDMDQIRKIGMNAFLGVAKGSDQPARFIILEYRGGGKDEKPVVLVGKGLTFDSGGISIKPAEKMDEMKSDMAGGAAVMGAVKAAADLKLKLNVVSLIPATENLPDGRAYKPGDILKSLSGKTIEILNTDAEGRLLLADALTYAAGFKPAAIVDVATLTGACIIALGEHVIGMLGTDEKLKTRIRNAAEFTGERVWELPLWEDYHEMIKSTVADYKNTGGRTAGTITAAAFLSKFVGEHPWVHLDIAGPAWLSKDMPYIPKGASGVGVRLLVSLLRNWHKR
jgi:leucyl aminopeptidase